MRKVYTEEIENPGPTVPELRRLVADTEAEMRAWILRYAISYSMLDRAERLKAGAKKKRRRRNKR